MHFVRKENPPLPLNRLETSLKAFTRVAVDFGGPCKVEVNEERSVICAYLLA